MRRKCVWLLAVLAAWVSVAASELTLAEGGKTAYTIVSLADQPADYQSAVWDLRAYLSKITGATFKPVTKDANGPRIYVGKRAPGDDAPFTGVRERRIKSVGDDIYIYGDGLFGTVGAVYDFLEKFCGCRWFGPWDGDTFIPSKPTLKFDSLDYKHAPSFYSLEFGGPWQSARLHKGVKNYLRRNRSFLQCRYEGASPEDAWKFFGPTTHGLAAYFPPGGHKPGTFVKMWAGPHPALADKAYFKDHPEYFTLNKEGKRVDNRQVCFSNPDVRRILTENIETVLKYEKYNKDDYAMIDLSFNDRSGGFCECPGCKKLEDKYKSPGGPYYDYLIELGNAFKNKYPRLVIRMIAYQPSMTGVPPMPGTKFPENISVIVAPLCQDFSKPLSHPYNETFRKEFEDWGKVAGKMWWWSYPILYPHGIRAYALFPGVYRNAENIKLAYKYGTRYIISEMGGSLIHNCAFKKLNDYLQIRLADDVNDSVDRIVKEYCDFMYGPASDLMIKYLRETHEACLKDPNYFIYYDDPRAMRELHSSANLVRWQGYFDEMAKLIGNDKYRQLQLGRARINLDAITLLRWDDVKKDFPDFATAEKLDEIGNRYVKEVTEDNADTYKPFMGKYGQGWELRNFLGSGKTAWVTAKKSLPVPEELVKEYGAENVRPIRLDGRTVVPKRLDEPDAANGVAIEAKIVDAKFGYMPSIMVRMPDGTYKRAKETVIPFKSSPLVRANLPTFEAAKGYKPYFVDRIVLEQADSVIVTGVDTKAEFFIGAAADPKNPKQEYDIYISVKFLEDNRVLIDRMYVCKVTPKSEAYAAKRDAARAKKVNRKK